MSGKKVKVPFQGRLIDGEEVPFTEVEERWNEYDLGDGTRIRIKLVLTKVIRLDEFNPDNEPVYVIASQNVLITDVPEPLKRRTS
jgi:hypothetical protein